MRSIEHAVIPCAGVGSRLNGGRPKSLTEIGGRSLLGRTLRALDHVRHVFVVVGFEKERVIQEALKYRKNLIFVQNAYFDRTNTLYSVRLASRMIRDDFLMVDGDVVFDPVSFALLLDRFDRQTGPAIGYSRRTTEDGVKVGLDTTPRASACTSFFRGDGEYEWAGIGRLNNRVLADESLFVYESIDPHLPVPAFPVDSMDIDTPADLELARMTYGGNAC
jgi:choline kinase